ncbi:hypothetical protein O181_070012 [Austropuccinia psidii MF-1]|uniref:AB hydrolase-1 domain-containing protein n=1 Tax=Austropuccinia psidii MF-1 TaxID=1389203 RepID=A0A9Q3F564_9BASI|nr:hypothetical protein [Austropuccinia psidii MF-1]
MLGSLQILSALICVIFQAFIPANATTKPKWLTLPSTPTLPGRPIGKWTDINGVKIWSAEFGCQNPGLPIILLHGGLGCSEYWGKIVEGLMVDRRVITVDTRGHGRSTMDDKPFTFELYASDITALLKSFNIPKAVFIAWSHMAVATIAAMMDSGNSRYIERAFLYGGYHDVAANNISFASTEIYKQFVQRAIAERIKLQPTQLKKFLGAVKKLDSIYPTYSTEQLAKISPGNKVTIAFGDHEEAIASWEINLLPTLIPGSSKIIMKDVSHFGVLQDPDQFLSFVRSFLV